MPKLDTTILQVTKPTIKLDELSIADVDASKFVGTYIPYVVVNNFEFTMEDLISFELNLDSILPSIRITVRDSTTNFMSRYFPKDGDIISFVIRSNNEDVFKPIKIDFDILNISPNFITGTNYKPTKFTLFGQMKITGLLTEFSESFSNLSSWDTLLQVSQLLKLGFASNEDTTVDTMTWINPSDTRLKFIIDVVANSYKDDNSFFNVFIDPYYFLNFVNVNKLFTVDTEIQESESYDINDPRLINDDPDNSSKIAPLLLSNHQRYQGSSKYLSNYTLFNNSGTIFLSNGYKRYSQFFDVESDNFISEFVDPLTTPDSDNLIHLKGRYIAKGDSFVPEGIAEKHVKYKYLGKQDSRKTNGNVFDNYMYANVLNYQNLEEINKMGITVNLDIADMSLTKYQVIPVFIFDYEDVSKQIEKDVDNTLVREPKLNEFISGNYMILNISYYYKFPGPIKQRMTLLKREYKAIK